MRIPRFVSVLILAMAVTTGWAIAEEPKHLPGLAAPPCGAIFGEPKAGSEPAKIYHMLIFYKALLEGKDLTCFGPAAKDFSKDPGKEFGDTLPARFIMQTVREAPAGKTFLVLVGVQHADPKTEKTYLVPSILTMTKTADGTLQGFKVIESRQLSKGRFIRSMSENDVVHLVATQEFVILGRAPQGAASENLDPHVFENIVDPYIAYLLNTANLECSEGKRTA